MTYFVRIWQNVDIDNIKKHLLIVGDVVGDCANCRQLGLKYAEVKSCSSCGNAFMFITARQASGSLRASGAVVKRIKSRRPDLTFIDYDDYKAVTGKLSAKDFFGS